MALSFIIIFNAVPSFWTENVLGVKLVFGIIAGVFLAFYFPYHLAKLLLTQRKNIVFQSGQLILKDAVSFTEILIDKSNLKGFSTSICQTNVWGFKTIIFYFVNGGKMEFPQFLYWNFKDIKPALEDNKISYLGHEPYRWKWFDTRHYFFDRNIS